MIGRGRQKPRREKGRFQGHFDFVLPVLKPSRHLMSCCPPTPGVHHPGSLPMLVASLLHLLLEQPSQGKLGRSSSAPTRSLSAPPPACREPAAWLLPQELYGHSRIGAKTNLEFTDMKFGCRDRCSIPSLSLMEPRRAEAERPWPLPHYEGSASRTALTHSPVTHLGCPHRAHHQHHRFALEASEAIQAALHI